MGFFSTESMKMKPWPTEFVLTLIFSIIFHLLLQPVTRWLLELLVPRFRSFDELRQRDWISRWISTLHAIIFAGLSFYILFVSGEIFKVIYAGGIGTTCPLTYPTLLFSCGYFIVDSIFALMYFNDKGTIAHHFAATIICFTICTWQAGPFYMIWFGLTEASTPFVNMRVFLTDLNLKDSPLFVANGIGMWLGFLIFRMPMIFCIPYYMLRYSYNYFKYEAPLVHFIAASTVYLIISSLNVYWFYLITKGLLKALSRKPGSDQKPMPKQSIRAGSPRHSRAKTKKED